MTCWLVKADPDDYGFAALRRDGEAAWDGVANALALRHLGAMRRGDRCFVYETGKVRAVRRPGQSKKLSAGEAGALREGDVIVLLGPPAALALAELRLLQG